MGVMIDSQILKNFNLSKEDYHMERYGTGLINQTYRLKHHNSDGQKDYIIQKINTQVFQDPYAMIQNHRLAANYLAKQYPDYLFLAPVETTSGDDLLEWNGQYWRMLPFINQSVAPDEAANPEQAYEAAQQFGRLVKKLSGIDLSHFQPSIPDFHNLTLRYSNFKKAIDQANLKRKKQADQLIEAYQRYNNILATYKKLKKDPDFPDRLMHHDTKISNVLLDKNTHKGICVIDLDTLMPGKIISDIGDMVRTYVCPVSEEETTFDKITVRESYYEALMNGYLTELGDDLTQTEKGTVFYAGQFMIYMQGIRFLADYLNGDTYYPTDYPLHNFNRAKNQLTLLEELNKKEPVLRKIIAKYL